MFTIHHPVIRRKRFTPPNSTGVDVSFMYNAATQRDTTQSAGASFSDWYTWAEINQ